MTYSQKAFFHNPSLALVCRKPAVRVPNLGVLAEHILVTMNHPGIHAHDSSPSKSLPTDLGAAGRDNTLQRQPRCWVQAPGLLDTGV